MRDTKYQTFMNGYKGMAIYNIYIALVYGLYILKYVNNCTHEYIHIYIYIYIYIYIWNSNEFIGNI